MQNQTTPLILTFNASDPVAAIGLQADLAVFASLHCHGLSVTTSLLASDTVSVDDLFPIDADWISDQGRLLLEDMTVAAFKVGIVGSLEAVPAIAEILVDYPDAPFVLDLFSSLLPIEDSDGEDILQASCELLLPQATLVVIPDTELDRLGMLWPDAGELNTDQIAARLIAAGCEYVLITQISLPDDQSGFRLYGDKGMMTENASPRLPGSFPGSNTTLSAALTCMLGAGVDVTDAVLQADHYMRQTTGAARQIGMGKLIPDRYFWTAGNQDAINQQVATILAARAASAGPDDPASGDTIIDLQGAAYSLEDLRLLEDDEDDSDVGEADPDQPKPGSYRH